MASRTDLQIQPWSTLSSDLRERWSRLVFEGGYNPTLDPRWVEVVLASQGAAERTQVATLTNGGDLVAVVPYVHSTTRTYGVPLRTIDLASNLMSYHPEIVSSEPAGEVLRQLLDNTHDGKWDLLRASGVPDDSPTALALRDCSNRGARMVRVPGDQSPYIKIDSDWDSYLKTRDKKFRANLTRAIRRMRDAGETAMRWFVGSESPAELLQCMLDIEQKSWKASAGTAITSRPLELEYHRRLLPALASMNALFANVLFVKDEPAAYVLACHHQGWIGQLKTSFDMQLQDAGARVIDESVRRAFEQGASTYDFLGDAAPHKLKWTDDVRPHSQHWLYANTGKAHLIHSAKQAVRAMQNLRSCALTSRRGVSANT